ncbi:plasmid mobilization protein [Methyloligella solikamskensis]|uniref:Mobilization protein n=1 Tax=Methyloligella solikamskensis TaxID=1177756 RepID=A0ABW3J7F8_9HYPH
MVASGSENRVRSAALRVRLSPEEAEQIRARADRAGLSVSAYLRAMALEGKPLRAERQPGVNRQLAARLIGELGRMSHAFRQAADTGDPKACGDVIDAVHRDLAELRALFFEALGREP